MSIQCRKGENEGRQVVRRIQGSQNERRQSIFFDSRPQGTNHFSFNFWENGKKEGRGVPITGHFQNEKQPHSEVIACQCENPTHSETDPWHEQPTAERHAPFKIGHHQSNKPPQETKHGK